MASSLILLKRSRLIYDIENICFIESDTLTREQYHTAHLIADVAQKGNIDRISRIIDLAVAHCREILFPFSKASLFEDILVDNLPDDYQYPFQLEIPDDFSQTTIDFLAKLIHEYVVVRAVAEWLSITNPPKKVGWEEKALALVNQIKSNLHGRLSRLRRKIHPF